MMPATPDGGTGGKWRCIAIKRIQHTMNITSIRSRTPFPNLNLSKIVTLAIIALETPRHLLLHLEYLKIGIASGPEVKAMSLEEL